MMYHKVSDIDQLKHTLIDCWTQLNEDSVNCMINQLPKRLMIVIKAMG